MKKIIMLVLFACGCSPAIAEIYPYIGVGSGRSSSNDEVHFNYAGKGEFGIKSRLWAASFSIAQVDGQNKIHTFQQGTIKITPFMFNAYARFPFTKRFNGYAGGGFSYVFADHILDEDLSITINRLGDKHTEKIRSGYGSQASGGFEYFFTKNLALGIEATYLFFSSEATTTDEYVAGKYFVTSTQSKTINLDTLMTFLSARYYF